MVKNFKKAVALLVSAAMVLGMSTSAFAAKEDKEAISSVAVDFEYELSSTMTADDVEVTSSTDGIDEVTVTGITNVAYGKKPVVTVSIKADSDYYFDDDKEAKKEFKKEGAYELGGDVAFSSAKYNSKSKLTLSVKLPKIGTDDGGLEVSEVEWDSGSGVVNWEEAEDAEKYRVRLYRNDNMKADEYTTNTWYDFGSVIKAHGEGDYMVKVRAYNGNYSGEYTDSDEVYFDEDDVAGLSGTSYNGGSSSGSAPAASSGGAWLTDSVGMWYCHPDHSYTRADWEFIDGYWYYFDSVGYVLTGWFQSPTSGIWYYLSPNTYPKGRMLTNTRIDGYYVNGDGAWVPGA